MTDERAVVPLPGAGLPPELLEALARGVAAAFAPPPVPPASGEGPDFLTAGQLAVRLGVSRETVRRLAIADVLPCTVVCEGKGRRPAGTRGGSLTTSPPAARTRPAWPSSRPGGGPRWRAAAQGKAEPPHAGRAD